MLLRFDPLREADLLAQLLARPGAGARATTMLMDAYRDGGRFIINFDLPGVDPEAIELTVDRDSLTVRAVRQWKPADGQEIIVAERPQGVFTRQLVLGANLDGDAMRASYERGVLTLTIPMSERAQPRRIEIAGGDDARPAAGGDTGSGGTAGQPEPVSGTDQAGSSGP